MFGGGGGGGSALGSERIPLLRGGVSPHLCNWVSRIWSVSENLDVPIVFYDAVTNPVLLYPSCVAVHWLGHCIFSLLIEKKNV